MPALNALLIIVGAAVSQGTAEAKRVRVPSLTEIAKQADQVAVGTVQSVDKTTGHDVIAVAAIWKGPNVKSIDRSDCRGESVGASVIMVLRPPRKWVKSGDAPLCAAFRDTPANRAELTELFGAPKPLTP